MSTGNSAPFLGYDSALGVAKETTYGTFATSTAFIEFNTESFKQSREEIKIEAINTTREFKKRLVGNQSIEGGFECPLNAASDGIMYVVQQAMGGSVTSSEIVAGVEYLHTFYIGDMNNTASVGSSDLKGLSFGVRKGDTNTWDFSGCRVNSMTIKGEVGAPVIISAEIIGQHASISATIPTVVLSDVLPVNFVGIEIKTGDSIGNVGTEYFNSFEFSINNNLNGDFRNLGSRNIVQPVAGMFEPSLKLVQSFDTLTSYNRFIQATMTAVHIIMDSEQTIGAGATTYSMEIKLPEVYWNSTMPEIGGPDMLTYEIEGTPFYRASEGSSVIIQTRNGTSSYI